MYSGVGGIQNSIWQTEISLSDAECFVDMISGKTSLGTDWPVVWKILIGHLICKNVMWKFTNQTKHSMAQGWQELWAVLCTFLLLKGIRRKRRPPQRLPLVRCCRNKKKCLFLLPGFFLTQIKQCRESILVLLFVSRGGRMSHSTRKVTSGHYLNKAVTLLNLYFCDMIL